MVTRVKYEEPECQNSGLKQKGLNTSHNRYRGSLYSELERCSRCHVDNG